MRSIPLPLRLLLLVLVSFLTACQTLQHDISDRVAATDTKCASRCTG